ncbi:LLM class flavin-dependent oxidoreductase [Lentibacillus lipolyticus]|nr:LLM class flavin-dependent oxidoreductase [Lentibacillus lipolyticus]
MKLSILDQSPVSSGGSAQEALHASVNLAVNADKWGYTRYWMAEHHDMTGLACPNPDVMLGIIGSRTERIRIGAGAVLLPHYKPFRVAETYNLLATLYPDRVDLGIGRAPGGSAEASMALSGNFLENVRHMPETLAELRKFLQQDFSSDEMYAKIKPSPVPATPPVPWLLGTSGKSAILAAEYGLPYVFGYFMSDEDGPGITQQYTEILAEKHPDKEAKKIVAVSVICAETSEEAEELALSSQLWSVQQAKGEGDGKLPSVKEARNYTYTDEDIAMVRNMRKRTIIGNPGEVIQELARLEALYNTDEFMVLTNVHSYEARKRSYELLINEILD